jgi:predicted alpha/beta superfamily hydrolase
LNLEQHFPDETPWALPPRGLLAPGEGTPHPRLHLHRAFASHYLPGKRDLIVYVPPGYDCEAGRTYPVLYLQDGQNLFDPRTSFIPGRTWEVREHADAAIRAGEVEPLIVVGIYNTGDRRLAEYTHESDRQMGGGEAAEYGLTLTREILPWIATRYRVRTDRESTGLGGSSLGGLVSLYLGLRYATWFGKLAVLSPSVWWNHKSILGYVNEHAPGIWDRPKLWLDVGDKGRQADGSRGRDAEPAAESQPLAGWGDSAFREGARRDARRVELGAAGEAHAEVFIPGGRRWRERR